MFVLIVFPIVLMCFGFMGIRAIMNGELRIKGGVVRKKSDPVPFWLSVGILIVSGVVGLILLGWLVFY